MSQLIIGRPFGELDPCDQIRFEPHTVFHLFLRQSPLRPFLLGQISKWASVDFQTFKPALPLLGGQAAQTRSSPWQRREAGRPRDSRQSKHQTDSPAYNHQSQTPDPVDPVLNPRPSSFT
jgi:hypothetical protein